MDKELFDSILGKALETIGQAFDLVEAVPVDELGDALKRVARIFALASATRLEIIEPVRTAELELFGERVQLLRKYGVPESLIIDIMREDGPVDVASNVADAMTKVLPILLQAYAHQAPVMGNIPNLEDLENLWKKDQDGKEPQH